MVRTAVPEAPINEDREMLPGEEDVRSSTDLLDRTSMTRKRRPRRCSSDLSASSGLVSRLLLARIVLRAVSDVAHEDSRSI